MTTELGSRAGTAAREAPDARRLSAVVRAPLWWAPKLLPLVAAMELAALTADVPADEGRARLLATLCCAVSIAAAAHVVNDLGDRSSDRIAGQPNASEAMGLKGNLVLLVLCGAGAIAPWALVPLDPWAGTCLAAIAALSLLYSLPPLRLKSRGLAGACTDALVAHVLPTAFAFLQVGAAGERSGSWRVAFAAALTWSAGFGFRSIVVHQVLDRDGDRAAGVRTYVVDRGLPQSVRTARDSFGLEVSGLLALWAVVAWESWGAAMFFGGHLGLWLYDRHSERSEFDSVPTTRGAWLPLAEFYEVWPALALGVALAVRDVGWVVVVAAVLVAFWPPVLKQARSELKILRVMVLSELAPRLRRRTIDAWWATYRVFWRIGRSYWRINAVYWRFHHARIDPIVGFVRRQRRRIRRRLGGLRRRGTPHGSP